MTFTKDEEEKLVKIIKKKIDNATKEELEEAYNLIDGEIK